MGIPEETHDAEKSPAHMLIMRRRTSGCDVRSLCEFKGHSFWHDGIVVSVQGNGSMVIGALEASSTGWASVGIPGTPGVMQGANAIIVKQCTTCSTGAAATLCKQITQSYINMPLHIVWQP